MLLDDGAPLRPSSTEARRLLAHELSKPEYADHTPLLVRLMDAIGDLFKTLLADSVGSLPPVLIVVVVVVIAAIVALTVPRLRRRHGIAEAGTALLAGEPADSDTLRRRARTAAERGDLEAAYTDFYRAIARSAEERALLPDARGSTAMEVAASLGRYFPTEAASLRQAGATFDRVCYGRSRAQAADVRALEDLDRRLTATRPTHDREQAPAPAGRPW